MSTSVAQRSIPVHLPAQDDPIAERLAQIYLGIAEGRGRRVGAGG